MTAREDVIRRIAEIENRHPGVMVWRPRESLSGEWEAAGEGWDIQSPDVSEFADLLAEKVL